MSEITTTGRRKTAVARLRMQAGSGSITVNNMPFEEYFPTIALQNGVLRPLELTQSMQKWDMKVRTTGGGSNGQAGALRLAISRALLRDNPELRPELKAAGLLTRDARMKERKKPGQPGARKRFQFSKR
jgi:small subunit ribosomal protein S9